MLVFSLTACQSKGTGSGSSGASSEAASSTIEPQDGYTMQTIIDSIHNEIGMQMPAELDDKVMKDIFHVNPEDTIEYYGFYGMSITSSDNLVAVHVKADKKDAVVEGLNERLADVRKSFEQYLQDQYVKAKNGFVYEKGDYVFLVIIGATMESAEADTARAREIIDEAFGG